MDSFGQRLRTIGVVLLVGSLSIVMGVIGFSVGPGTSCDASAPTYAAEVRGRTITEGEFRAAYTLTGFNRYPAKRAQALRLRENTMNGLVERALLADEAQRMGFSVTPEEVMRHLREERVVLLSGPVDAPPGYPSGEIRPGGSFEDSDGNFSVENLRRFVQYHLRRSMEEFAEWQVEETLAQRARDAVTATVVVSPREVHDQYVRETESARIKYARFTPSHYRDQVEVTDEALTAWMGEHTEEVDAEYQRQRHRYTDLEPQVRARHILIKAAQDADESVRSAARNRAQALLLRARGGENFEALAREFSEDEGSARRGGDLGYNPRGRMVPPFDEAQFGLEPGQITEELVETRFGFHIIKSEGRREGNVPEEEAKRELAENLYRRDRAGELARENAQRALTYLREGHTMDELDRQLLYSWSPPAPPTPEGQEGQVGPDGQPVPPGQPGQPGQEGQEGQPEQAQAEPPERAPGAPEVQESSPFGRSGTPFRAPYNTAPLARAAYELSMDDALPEEPLELGGEWVVFQLTERTEATEEGFTDTIRRQIGERLLDAKRREVLMAYVTGLREQAEDDGAIRINETMLDYQIPTEGDEEGGGGGGSEEPLEPE